MSNPKKHIDDIFKKELQSYEVTPDPALWSEISKNLPQKKKKQRVIPLWFWPAGIAASLILIFTLTKLNNSSEKTLNVVFEESVDENCPEEIKIETVLNNEKNNKINLTNNKVKETLVSKSNPNIITKKTTTAKLNSIEVYTIKNNSNTSISKVVKVEKETLTEKENIVNFKQPINYNNAITHRGISKITKNETLIKNQQPKEDKSKTINKLYKLKPEAIVEKIDKENNGLVEKQLVINEITKDDLNTKEKVTSNESSKKWSIQPQIAPLVYNSTSGNSSIEADFENQVKSTDAGISYGIKIAYQASPKWQIRSGVSTANINVFTNQILDQSLSSGKISSVQFKDEEIELTLDPPVSANDPTGRTDLTSGQETTPPKPTEGVLQQQISYIEIPIEFTYRLLNKRFGTSIIGGASAFVLNQNNNEVFFEQLGNVESVGRSNNLNSTSFSGNLGLGLDYKITKTILISVEPTIKFQFNAFDSSTDFNPYIFGVYSGIKFNL